MKRLIFVVVFLLALGLYFFIPSLASAAAYAPAVGGTGTTTPPKYGQLLVGNANKTYTLTATSSLGLPTFADLAGSSGFSTTSADYWKTQRNFFATTSADYWKTQANFFSTTSSDWWKSQSSFFSTTSVTYWMSVTDLFSTSSTDFWKTQRNFFSTTSADWWKTQNSFFSTTSASYFLSLNQGAAFSTTSADHWKSQTNFFSTTSVAYWKSVTDLFSTTSASYLLSTYDKGFFFSTTSADAWKAQRNFFSTSSADWWKTQNNFFATTSADYWKSLTSFFSTTSTDYFVTQRNFFSTTSADWWKSQNNFFATSSADYWKSLTDFFSTTSAQYFAHSSTTIPKTYTANTWLPLQTFSYSSTTYGSFVDASSTRQVIGTLAFGGVTSNTWTGFCTSITGSAALCDGDDASGGGGGGAFPFTPVPTHFGKATNATTTQIAFTNGLTASSSVRFGGDGALFFLVNNGGNVGVGSSTPWALLSISSSTPDYVTPFLGISTSTHPTGDLFAVFATTTTLGANQVTNTQGASIFDSGVRIVIGAFQKYSGLLLDQLNINGRINTGEWSYMECSGAAGMTTNVTANTNGVCGQWGVRVDGTASVGPLNNGAQVASGVIGVGGARIAANGGGFFGGGSVWMLAATNTPIMDISLSGGTFPSESAGNSTATSTMIAGFVNVNPAGTSFEVEPTAGCYVIASSTRENWAAVCLTSATNATYVDTGVSSTTVDLTRFRIEMDRTTARFYKQNATSALQQMAAITTTYPGATQLVAGVYTARATAGLTASMKVQTLKMWFRRSLFRN